MRHGESTKMRSACRRFSADTAGIRVRSVASISFMSLGARDVSRCVDGGLMDWLCKALLPAGTVVVVMAVARLGGRRLAGWGAAFPHPHGANAGLARGR